MAKCQYKYFNVREVEAAGQKNGSGVFLVEIRREEKLNAFVEE